MGVITSLLGPRYQQLCLAMYVLQNKYNAFMAQITEKHHIDFGCHNVSLSQNNLLNFLPQVTCNVHVGVAVVHADASSAKKLARKSYELG